MTYVFNPWRSLKVLLREARTLRLDGYHRPAVQLLEAVAEQRRHWRTQGTFRPEPPRRDAGG